MHLNPLRVLVVDDSALYRKAVRIALESIPGVEVIGTASNGKIALERILADKPDLVTLDMEMPELNGLGLLHELASRQVDTLCLMVSSLTLQGARATSEALELGAFDFVLKPTGSSPEANVEQLRRDLAPRIEAARVARENTTRRGTLLRHAEPPLAGRPIRCVLPATTGTCQPSIVGIGVSTGGPAALRKLLPQFPASFPIPIVIVQHMPPIFTKTLADELNKRCPLEVLEGADGMAVIAGRAIIAPGGRQMRVERNDHAAFVRLTDDPAERNCRPAVDYLFRSLATAYGRHALGVILTGMGDDGLRGCQEMKEQGSQILAQDEMSSVVYGMPRAVAEAGIVDYVTSIDGIAARLNDVAAQGVFA
jgi:two-component system chemotaxis response regulator CheB